MKKLGGSVVRKLALVQLVVVIVLFSGCGHCLRARANKRQDAVLRHTISYPGETLSSISLWYTGSAHNWQLLRDKNQLQPEKLYLGTTVNIPAHLLQRREPMPEAFLKKRYAAKASKSPRLTIANKRVTTALPQPKLMKAPEKEEASISPPSKEEPPYLRAALEVEQSDSAARSLAEMDCEVLRDELMDKLLECKEKSSGSAALPTEVAQETTSE